MAFVPLQEHDIFVSYAHVDDQPPPSVESGWVSTLIGGLKTKLSQQLGRSDSYSLWIDHRLNRHASVTNQLVETLQKTAVFIVILSPAYAASEWCQREKDTIFKLVRDRKRAGSRVFVVEKNQIQDAEHHERTAEFQDLKGYRFWVERSEGGAPTILGSPQPNPNDPRYYDMVTDLAHDLAHELKQLKVAEDSGDSVASTEPVGPAVFLAEPTEDFDDQHADVRRYLDQAGIRVLPSSTYSRSPDGFRKAAEQDLKDCKVFAQLLSSKPEKKYPDLPQGIVRLQWELAKELDKPILQWRDSGVEVLSIGDSDHRAFLERDTVLSTGLTEFKRRVRDEAFRIATPEGPPIRAFVFVDNERSDSSIGDDVCRALTTHGAGYSLPLRSGKPAEVRQDFEHNLLSCDALIIVYGDSSVKWVRNQLFQLRKLIHRRTRPLRGLAIFEGPPDPKEPLGMALPDMQVVDGRDGAAMATLRPFLESIRMEQP